MLACREKLICLTAEDLLPALCLNPTLFCWVSSPHSFPRQFAGPHGAQGSHGKPPFSRSQTPTRPPRCCAAVNGDRADPTLNTLLLVPTAAGRGEAQHRALHRLRPLRRPRKLSRCPLRHRTRADFCFWCQIWAKR